MYIIYIVTDSFDYFVEIKFLNISKRNYTFQIKKIINIQFNLYENGDSDDDNDIENEDSIYCD